MMMYWLAAFFVCLAVVFGLIYMGGAQLGLWKGPPEPTTERAAADIASGSMTRQAKGFRDLKKLSPDPANREVADALQTCISGRRGRHQLEAIKALGDWGDPTDADALTAIVTNTHWGNNDLRHSAIETLGRLGGDRARELLMECLKHEPDRAVATRALANLDRKD